MKPKEILCQWVDAFNNADTETIANLYDDNAINHQVANEPVIGKEAIRKCLKKSFLKQKWFVLLKIFLKMDNGQYWSGVTH